MKMKMMLRCAGTDYKHCWVSCWCHISQRGSQNDLIALTACAGSILSMTIRPCITPSLSVVMTSMPSYANYCRFLFLCFAVNIYFNKSRGSRVSGITDREITKKRWTARHKSRCNMTVPGVRLTTINSNGATITPDQTNNDISHSPIDEWSL